MFVVSIMSSHLQCLKRAVECRRKAEAAFSAAARQSYLEAEACWLAIADSYIEPEQLKNGHRSFEVEPHAPGEMTDLEAAT